MSINRDQLLTKIDMKFEEPCKSKASNLLFDPDAQLVDGAPTREDVRSLLPTLKARLENSRRSGVLIYGLEQVISALSAMQLTDVVVGYGYISPRAAGVFYFSYDEEDVVGVTLIER